MNPLQSRRHPEGDQDLDSRPPYRKDQKRILYCAGLHRLTGVTQVISPADNETVQNRLTHTLKVAHVARRLAEKLAMEPIGGIGVPNVDIVESAALAHDLGHPPFEPDKLIDARQVSLTPVG